MPAAPETQVHPTQTRKADHLRICLEGPVQCAQITTGLERYRFTHCGLPELDLQDIDLSTTFLGHRLGAPLLISSMTGGTDAAHRINRRLAAVAQRYRLAMGVGSQRVGVENPELMNTFAVRDQAPDILLLANLGAVQFNYGYGVDQCRRVIDKLGASGLILHLNPLQEAVQNGGDTNFKGLLHKIEQVCATLPVPVIVKEVGNGISAPLVQRLVAAGVAAVDVAGAGGTSWAKVESERAADAHQRRLGQTFGEWGLPTADCIVQARAVAPDLPLIASGGLRHGLDVAKAIALGADVAGLAMPFLRAASESEADVAALAEVLMAEIKTVLFCTGQSRLPGLQQPGLLQETRG
ncbi:MAG: type 2 isopentenyl-diphosphate Delta-isomerase [Leptolyngbya sp. DLM2.Bin27]|nr:MAG: type 2 isopentenyl-diphosphate Delta-isomerase [Leptolyngbya sp. DLM2.Bin27]